jgi:hypothetical protein
MFGKHEITLNRVRGKVTFREGAEKLTLRVDGDAMRLVVGLEQTQRMLKVITTETPKEEIQQAARFFASVIFGDEQTEKLMEFYLNDGSCVINVCGKYMTEVLFKKITAAQKKTAKADRKK